MCIRDSRLSPITAHALHRARAARRRPRFSGHHRRLRRRHAPRRAHLLLGATARADARRRGQAVRGGQRAPRRGLRAAWRCAMRRASRGAWCSACV
eukprot:1967598-Prymnesium_polylepis.1